MIQTTDEELAFLKLSQDEYVKRLIEDFIYLKFENQRLLKENQGLKYATYKAA